ncbi:MAG: glycosyltransferase [Pseudobutyrivibrio sp.]|nr:glycosyltransferase [Pseudobutyrivibrio sp.]
MKNFQELIPVIAGRRVLYITTKNTDYIRVSQEVALLEQGAASLDIIGSPSRSYIKRILHVFVKLFRANMGDYDLTFVGFAPQLVLPFFGGKLKKKPLIIDFFISVYDTMVDDRKKFKRGGLVAGMCHRLDEKTLAQADYVVCDTRAHGTFFAEEFNSSIDKEYVLYLEADKSIYYPRQIERDSDKKQVLYFGSILNLQGVDVILQAMDSIKDRKDIEFTIIGPVSDSYTKPEGDNIFYIPWLSQDKLAERIAGADLCLAGHFSGDIMKAKRTIPGKAYIYEAMNKPMILGDGMANRELFTADDRHIFVPMGDAQALGSAIIDFFER